MTQIFTKKIESFCVGKLFQFKKRMNHKLEKKYVMYWNMFEKKIKLFDQCFRVIIVHCWQIAWQLLHPFVWPSTCDHDVSILLFMLSIYILISKLFIFAYIYMFLNKAHLCKSIRQENLFWMYFYFNQLFHYFQ